MNSSFTGEGTESWQGGTFAQHLPAGYSSWFPILSSELLLFAGTLCESLSPYLIHKQDGLVFEAAIQ